MDSHSLTCPLVPHLWSLSQLKKKNNRQTKMFKLSSSHTFYKSSRCMHNMYFNTVSERILERGCFNVTWIISTWVSLKCVIIIQQYLVGNSEGTGYSGHITPSTSRTKCLIYQKTEPLSLFWALAQCLHKPGESMALPAQHTHPSERYHLSSHFCFEPALQRCWWTGLSLYTVEAPVFHLCQQQ